jgi:integrase
VLTDHARREERPMLLERLMEVVRPEFRADVFHPPQDSPVFFYGFCRIPACPSAVIHGALMLCASHYQTWCRSTDRKGGLDEWIASVNVKEKIGLTACAVDGCNRSRKTQFVCRRHHEAWQKAGRPEIERWLVGVTYRPPRLSVGPEASCEAPGCERWTEGPGHRLCRCHDEKWRRAGRGDLDTWIAEFVHGENPRLRFDGIPRQLRLELQFGLQCRHDEAVKLAPLRALKSAVNLARTSGVESLLDLTTAEWNMRLGGARLRSFGSMARCFLLDTRFRLEALLIEDDPWADQYPRDSWDLRLLGMRSGQVRHLRFEPIAQPWLRNLTKRWCRWQLSRGLSPVTVTAYLAGCRRLAGYLELTCPGAGPEGLTRTRIEAWLAASSANLSAPTRAASVGGVRCFLNDVHRHGWEPRLAAGALVFGDDLPRPKHSNPRWIEEHVMRQLEAPSALARFPTDDGRVLVRILIECGLRLKDARTLPFDCVTRDDVGAPYLAWLNRKMADRPAFFPISEDLATTVADQQDRVSRRFPDGCPWLFPARNANLDGSKTLGATGFRQQLDAWFERIELKDARGEPVRVTAHQFRHTVGTRLINRDVPQHVVQQLLDHMSPEMTGVYARLHDKTIRRHWEQATKVNAEGETVAVDRDHPLADAQWTKVSLVRAKVTLPNGYCGAPVQTDCEYANPCLDCNFFLTTVEFLPVHRRQRDETVKMVTEAEDQGLVRIVERNTRTMARLDHLIDRLEQIEPDEILADETEVRDDAAG